MEEKQKEDEVLSKLKFIGQIRRGEKISTKYLNVQGNTIITTFDRTFIHHESREDTFTFLNDTIKASFELLHKYGGCKNSFEKVIMGHILSDLESCKSGLQNIKGTYSNDIMFSCRIDTLLQAIEARMAGFNEKRDEDISPKTSEKRIETSKNGKNV